MSSESIALASSVVITAPAANAGVIYLGDVSVAAANGYVLAAGASLRLGDLISVDSTEVILDLSKVYIDAATSADTVTVCYLERVGL